MKIKLNGRLVGVFLISCASLTFCEINENIYFIIPPFESTKITPGTTQNKFISSSVIQNSFNRLNVTHRPLDLLNSDKNFVSWIFGAFGAKPPNEEQTCKSCECGISYKTTRIVGGTETQVNMYPWIVTLTYNARFYCGATVINDRYLLTAAHCVNGFNKERLAAVFLVHDRGLSESQTFSRKIKTIVRHKAYNSGTLYNNDIALLEVDVPLEFNHIFRPVCLPSSGRSYSGQKGIVIGWGALVENGGVSNKLREVEVPILSNDDCKKTGYGSKISENMLCAGYPEGMKDSCQGDSGGPLLVTNGTRYEIIGVVSWGEGCAKPNYPGVYTRVNRYLTWIMSNTKTACYCT